MNEHETPCKELVEIRQKVEDLRVEDRGVAVMLQNILERQKSQSAKLDLVLRKFEALDGWKNRTLGFIIGAGVLGVGAGAGIAGAMKVLFGG